MRVIASSSDCHELALTRIKVTFSLPADVPAALVAPTTVRRRFLLDGRLDDYRRCADEVVTVNVAGRGSRGLGRKRAFPDAIRQFLAVRVVVLSKARHNRQREHTESNQKHLHLGFSYVTLLLLMRG